MFRTALRRSGALFASSPKPTIINNNTVHRLLTTSSSPLQQLTPATIPTPSPFPPPSTTVDPSVPTLLPFLKSQSAHYITIHINAFPFLVTPGDTLTLPFLLKDVNVGDVLRLTHASLLGSRDYTLKGAPWIDPSLFELRARVVEVTSEPMRTMIKKKQRNRRKKVVTSKHRYTVLRIGDLKLGDLGSVEGVEAVAAPAADA